MSTIIRLVNILICLQVIIALNATQAMTRNDLKFEAVYIGCYNENYRSRSMIAMKRTTNDLTISLCQYYCVGLPFFGLQSGNVCVCGEFPDSHGKAWENECNLPCAGNQSETCGGHERNSVYKRQDPQLHQGYVKPYNYFGCFFNPYDISVLPTQKTELLLGMRMNILLCRYLCEGFSFFGLKSGSECYCGNNIRYESNSTSCDSRCFGSILQTCGGRSSISVYRTRSYDQNNNRLYDDDIRNTEPNVPVLIGCYADVTHHRALPYHKSTELPMSVGLCNRLCFSFTFFAIQNGFDCYCGEVYGIGENSQKPNSECKTQCNSLETGASQGCGGIKRNSVYKTSRDPFVNDAINWSDRHLGCYEDEENDRDLPVMRGSSKYMSVEKCQKLCFDYQYLGIQKDSCWCGNRYGRHGKVDQNRCSIRCHSSKKYRGRHACGQKDKISVYKGFGMGINSNLRSGC